MTGGHTHTLTYLGWCKLIKKNCRHFECSFINNCDICLSIFIVVSNGSTSGVVQVRLGVEQTTNHYLNKWLPYSPQVCIVRSRSVAAPGKYKFCKSFMCTDVMFSKYFMNTDISTDSFSLEVLSYSTARYSRSHIIFISWTLLQHRLIFFIEIKYVYISISWAIAGPNNHLLHGRIRMQTFSDGKFIQ